MATERFFVCSRCEVKEWAQGLFDALRDRASNAAHQCSKCKADMELQLTLNFGLGLGPHRFKVLDAFLPDTISSWPDEKGSRVSFYPFLILLASLEEDNTKAWLPYWHLVAHPDGTLERKYGQWAACVDLDLYSSLIRNAQSKGYFN
jgi:hypothetical protein